MKIDSTCGSHMQSAEDGELVASYSYMPGLWSHRVETESIRANRAVYGSPTLKRDRTHINKVWRIQTDLNDFCFRALSASVHRIIWKISWRLTTPGGTGD
jgi:hypothetical protein